MDLTDLTKDIQRLLLDHWSKKEINERLGLDPVYFVDQVANPHFSSLRRQGQAVPRLRLKKNPEGEFIILLG